MKIIVTVPFEQHDALLRRCETESVENRILRNGVVIRDDEGHQVAVQLLCDLREADALLDYARKFYPDAALAIEQSISLAKES